MKELTMDASIENIEKATEFVNRYLEAADCPPKVQMQIDIAIDELLGNIARYAYSPGNGRVTLRIEILEEPRLAAITFTDGGIPYNPLTRENPDITLSAAEREAGGLGIYMVKKSMDEISYEYRDGCNMLTIRKYFEKPVGIGGEA